MGDRMLRAARSPLIAAVLALSMMAPGAAAATGTVTDPAGDRCPAGVTVDCGSDLLSTTWTTHPDDSVTLSVSRVETSCRGNVFTIGPTIFMQAPDGTLIGAVGADPSDRWLVNTAQLGGGLPLRPTSTNVGGVATTTVVLSEAGRVGCRDFDYFITNSCGNPAATVFNPFFGVGAPSDTLPNGGKFGSGAVNVKVRFPPASPPPAPGPTVTTGTVHDPAGDNCVGAPATCGADLRSTTWATHPDGSVTISFSRVPRVCNSTKGAGPEIGEVMIAMNSPGGILAHLGGPRGGELWQFLGPPTNPVVRETDTIVGGVKTTTLLDLDLAPVLLTPV